MITVKGTSVGDKGATDRLIPDDVAVCLRHNQNYARDLRHVLHSARNVGNGYIYEYVTLPLRHAMS